MANKKDLLNKNESGSGQDRTVDLTIFNRALVPTELPSQLLDELVVLLENNRDPDGT